jgi:hypothetical protein
MTHPHVEAGIDRWQPRHDVGSVVVLRAGQRRVDRDTDRSQTGQLGELDE